MPEVVRLAGEGEQALLVTAVLADGREVDVSGEARLRSTAPGVARVTEGPAMVRPVGNGSATVVVRVGALERKVAVSVTGQGGLQTPSFTAEVLPLLAHLGCAQAACHAKQGGKQGFQLSVLSYDPEADHAAITLGAGGRRINRLEPARSLLLLKATAALPHGGGQRVRPGSPEHRLLLRWLAAGAPFRRVGEPSLTALELAPPERVLAPRGTQRLLATAVYADGTRRDVTRLAEYLSNEAGIAEAEHGGRVRGSGLPGEAAVMARYLGRVAVARFIVPRGAAVAPAAYAALPRQNYIDEHVYRKLARLNLLPSPQADDATFLRRAGLDLIGTLPTPEEVRRFLAECEAERRSSGLPPSAPALRARAAAVERFLERPEYADYWATRWVNLLLVDRDPLFPKGAFAYDRWVRDAFRENRPFDGMARELLTATGETYRDGPANFYRALATPVEQARSLTQLFLGVRLECAQCHHHPSERWSQDDFYAMAAYFARVGRKGAGSEFEEVVFTRRTGEVLHPKTGAPVPPRPLGGEAPGPTDPEEDPREHLARWVTAPENPFFARAAVNRVWGLLMGSGLVEPVDDFRVTNPASNEALLDALARDFAGAGYDLKHLLRTITASAAYQRASTATPANARDTRNYARFLPRRLPAEVLMDAVSQVTGVPEGFQGHPRSTRAIQMWDNKLPVEFLEVFGRPSRLSVCECDRPTDGSVTQVLHLMNNSKVQARLTAEDGTVARLVAGELSNAAVVEELYLAAYGRPPRPPERAAALGAFLRPGTTRRAAVEDLLWVLLNTPEFVLQH